VACNRTLTPRTATPFARVLLSIPQRSTRPLPDIETVRENRFGPVTIVLQVEEFCCSGTWSPAMGAEHEARLIIQRHRPSSGLTGPRFARTSCGPISTTTSLRGLHRPPGLLDWFRNNTFSLYEHREYVPRCTVSCLVVWLPSSTQSGVACQRTPTVFLTYDQRPGAGPSCSSSLLRALTRFFGPDLRSTRAEDCVPFEKNYQLPHYFGRCALFLEITDLPHRLAA